MSLGAQRVTLQETTTPCDEPSIIKCSQNAAYATQEGNMTRNEPIRGDLRVQRTRNLIVEALIELTIQKGFAAVTVQDIVRRAGINRATFYRHYQDKFDLLDQYAQAVYELPDSPLDPGSLAGEEAAIDKAISGLVRLLEHVRRHAKFFRVMLGKHGDPGFAAKIRQYIQTRIRRSLPEALLSDENSADLYLSYVSSGAVGVLAWWLEHEIPYSPEQLATILFRFIVAELATL
jgi:AcrR family transcriptional regulator